MKNFLVAVFLAALTLAPLASQAAHHDGPPPAFPGQAKLENRGGFSGPISGAAAETVANARNLSDDSPVMLTGNIVSQVADSKDKYIFKDDTGEIVVKIGKKVFMGKEITPQDRVRISGKMDKDFGFGNDIEVKVRQIEVLQ